MGRSITPTYRIELSGVVDITRRQRIAVTHSAWRVKSSVYGTGYGAPTEANIAAYVRGFEEATLPGGVNDHCGILRVGGARIVHQHSGEVVAAWTCPMFQAV